MDAPRFYTTFVSYATDDLGIATRLVADLEARSVKCWFYPRDYSLGKRTQGEVNQRRRESERVVVLCSYRSLMKDRVLSEIAAQKSEDPDKLVPISLDTVWLQPGYHATWSDEDLKPFLQERSCASFDDGVVYEDSLSLLLGALTNRSPAPERAPTRAAATRAILAKRLKNVERLLQIRADANDLTFVAQILDALAAVLMLKYDLADTARANEPQLYKQLVKLFAEPARSSRLVEDLGRLAGWAGDMETLRQSLEQVGSAVSRRDTSPSVVVRVQSTLTQLYLIVAALITDESDEDAAEVQVQTAMSLSRTEDDHVEYKSSLRYNLNANIIDTKMEDEVIIAIAGLANHDGGTLYIGIGDHGEIIGTELDLATFKGRNPMDQFHLHFDQLVNARLGVANYQIVEANWAEPEGKKVFVVKVKPGRSPTFVRTANNESEFWLRRGAQTRKLSPRDFYEYLRARWPSDPPRAV